MLPGFCPCEERMEHSALWARRRGRRWWVAGQRLHLAGARPPWAGGHPPERQPGPLPACGSSAGPGTSSPRHLIKLTMCCYLHADLPGFLSSCSEPWSFCALTARQSLNAIFVRPRCALIEDAFVPSRFPLCSIYKALL